MTNQNNLQIYAVCITIAFVVLLILVIFRKIGRPLSEAEAKEKIRRRQQREEAWAREEQEKKRVLMEQENVIKNLKPPVLYLSSASDHDDENIVFTIQDGDKKTHLFRAKDMYEIRRQPFLNALYESARPAIYHSRIGEVLIPG